MTRKGLFPIKIDDRAPVPPVAVGSDVLVVHPSLPVKSVRECIVLARSRPGPLVYGSGGVGGAPHLTVALMNSMAGLDMVHVPYKGGAPAIADLLAGEGSLIFNDPLTTLPYIRSAKFRPVAVSSAKRSTALPDVPAVAESGLPGYEVAGWYGALARAGTPSPTVDRLYAEIERIVRMPEVRERLLGRETEAFTLPSGRFAGSVKSEVEKWERVVKSANIKAL